MPSLYPRHSSTMAAARIDAFPAVVIQGARQVGKSTFAEMVTRERARRSVTLDDPATLAATQADPVTFVDQFPNGTLVIDEVQRAPGLLLPLKASIDRDRRPGRFVLTGSSDLLRSAPDSLAGRAVTIPLHTLSQGELHSTGDDLIGALRRGWDAAEYTSTATREHYVDALTSGGYPEAHRLSGRLRNAWFDGYVERLLGRDLSDVAPRVDAARVARVLRLIAANQSGEFVSARIARDAGLPETSVRAYADALTALYLVDALPPWTPNLTSRESSRRKTIVSDAGLALRLSRVTSDQLLTPANSFIGPAMEGFIAMELRKQQSWSAEEYELFHFRDRNGLEVDIVAELSDGSIMAFEVKAGATLKTEHFSGLRSLRDKVGDRFIGGYVVNTATRGSVFADRLWSIPASALWAAA